MSPNAIFSADRIYRYTLSRNLGDLFTVGKPGYVAFCCLNPSTADETADDPTIRRCIGFTKLWGYSAFVMVNLFAIRATDPKVMLMHPEPVGAANDEWLLKTAKDAAVFICGWGNDGEHKGRSLEVTRALRSAGVHLMRLGELTNCGQPRHPLYLSSKLEPIPL